MNEMIPLFDLGNVVVTVDFKPFVQWLCDRSAHKDFEKCQKVLSSSLVYDLEFGHLSPAGFAARLASHHEAKFSQAELEEAFCSIFPGLVPGMDSVIEELAAAGPVYCLSNTNEIHLAHLRKHYPLLGKFTKIFTSHELHKRKPYPAIYQDVANELNVDAKTLLFFDDVQANVEGARKAGLEAHLFREAGQVRKLKGMAGTGDKE